MHKDVWKKFERWAAWFINGRRYEANTGGRIDVEGKHALAQVKYRSTLSHTKLTQLAIEMQMRGRAKDKIGMVIHAVPPGIGKKRVALVTFTCEHFDEYFCLRTGEEPKRIPRDFQFSENLNKDTDEWPTIEG